MKKYLLVVQKNKASQGKRLLNIIVDRIVLYTAFTIVGFIIAIGAELTGLAFFRSALDFFENMDKLTDLLITTLVYLTYMIVMEYKTGRSVGKYVTGTKVVSTDGTKAELTQIIYRNLARLVPFDAFSFLGTDGWHDRWTDTRVVNAKQYEQDRLSGMEISQIGQKEES